MAAYAALVSLMNLLEQLQRHPQPPITLHTNQVQTLTQKIAFLLNFLEVYNSHYSRPEMEHMRNHIADVAHAAEDVIETHIVNRIHAQSTSYDLPDLSHQEVDEAYNGTVAIDKLLRSIMGEEFTYTLGTQDPQRSSVVASKSTSTEQNTIVGFDDVLNEDDIITSLQNLFVEVDEENSGSIDLHEVIQDMGFVEKEVLEVKDMLGAQDPQRFITTDVVASKSTSTEHNIMVGFDDVLEEMLHKLTGQPDSRRQIIPISGMGGVGKTTLARNVYINPLTEYYFDICAWVTISQEYNVRDILLGVLGEKKGSGESKSEAEVGERVYKKLCGRRYLIVMDDMWSHEAWDGVKLFFPNECNGSKIIVTTRLTNVASYLTTNCHGLEMDFLDEDKSWSLFCKTVFGEEDGCPSELQHVGKQILTNCKGLPLSIVVIGGLLEKSKQTHEHWEYIAENLNSIVNLEENERCFKILHASYNQLPAHLKACFLYMAVFPEDYEIPLSELIGLWVAESFLKPISGKSLEESAEEYLMDLVGRNLIMVHEDELFDYEKVCNIHDLLRDLCIREARKEKFICVTNEHNEGLNTQRLIAIHKYKSKNGCVDSLKGGPTTRSLIGYCGSPLPLSEFRLLRVFTRIGQDGGRYRLGDISRLVNMRYLSVFSIQPMFPSVRIQNFVFPSSISQLWNLQTLYVSGLHDVVAPLEIWKLPLIRQIKFHGLILPNPPSGLTDERDDFVLHELHTLVGITNLKVGEEVIKRIPNVTTLGLIFDHHCEMPLDLNNLDRLYKLEDFSIDLFHQQSLTELMPNLTFPHSLKKLTLNNTKLHWEDMSMTIGSLPHLQMLILHRHSFIGWEWKTVEGQFCSLRYLRIEECSNLEYWTAESTHFPCLESLHLVSLRYLEDTPRGFGHIPTLKSIIVQRCSDSAVWFAKDVLMEQKELGNQSLRVRILLTRYNDIRQLEILATHNFQIETYVSNRIYVEYSY